MDGHMNGQRESFQYVTRTHHTRSKSSCSQQPANVAILIAAVALFPGAPYFSLFLNSSLPLPTSLSPFYSSTCLFTCPPSLLLASPHPHYPHRQPQLSLPPHRHDSLLQQPLPSPSHHHDPLLQPQLPSPQHPHDPLL